jgi:hypothetical protein
VIRRHFIRSVGSVLFTAALAILLSVHAASRVLERPDPFISLPWRDVFYLVAGLELLSSVFLLVGSCRPWKLVLTIWIASTLLVYRFGLWSSGGANLFSYIGNLNRIAIAPKTLDGLFWGMVSYMILGSCGFLTLDWRAIRKLAYKTSIASELPSTSTTI